MLISHLSCEAASAISGRLALVADACQFASAKGMGRLGLLCIEIPSQAPSRCKWMIPFWPCWQWWIEALEIQGWVDASDLNWHKKEALSIWEGMLSLSTSAVWYKKTREGNGDDLLKYKLACWKTSVKMPSQACISNLQPNKQGEVWCNCLVIVTALPGVCLHVISFSWHSIYLYSYFIADF